MPYVSSTANDNGVDGFIGNKDNVRVFNNCLTIANSGSVGSVFFHPYGFVASDHVTELKGDMFDKYVYLFLSRIVSQLGEKYSFNREINDDRLLREKVMLPVSEDDQPDYTFMHNYMAKKEQQLFYSYIGQRRLTADPPPKNYRRNHDLL